MLQEKGAAVTVMSRSTTNLDEARAVLGTAAGIVQLDVLDRDAMAATFAEFAPFDILVNAATGGERATGPFSRWTWTASRVRSASSGLCELGPARRRAPDPERLHRAGQRFAGAQVHAGHVGHLHGRQRRGGLRRAVAPELAPRRINVVSPGIIDTPMFAWQGDARTQFLANATRHAAEASWHARRGRPRHPLRDRERLRDRTTVDVDGGALLP